MSEPRLDFLTKAFPNYKVYIEADNLHAIIFNPVLKDNIDVYYYEEDDYTPFVTCFSFQHCHLTDEEDVIQWINEITTGKKLVIEFFKNGQRHFGGDIEADELLNVSYQQLEQYTGYCGTTKLLHVADSFKVRGWNTEDNFDAVFVSEKDGSIAIESLPKFT